MVTWPTAGVLLHSPLRARRGVKAARRARSQGAIDDSSAAARRGWDGGARRLLLHTCRRCTALRLRRRAPSAALRAWRRRPHQCPRTAPRRAWRWASRCGVCSWCWFTGALAAPSAVHQRSRKRTRRAVHARCRVAAWREGRAAARRVACTATEQSAALSGERVRRGAHFVACRARLRVDARVRACRHEAIGPARRDAAAAAGDSALLHT